MRKTFLAFCCVFSLGTLLGQFEFDTDKFIDGLVGGIKSDRPGKAINPRTCGFMTLQIQAGFNYEDFSSDWYTSNSFGTPIDIKLGLSQNLELNTSLYYLNYRNEILPSGPEWQGKGMLSPQLAIRYTVVQGTGWKPTLGLQAGMVFGSSKGDFQQPQMGSTFILATSNKFSRFSLNTNIGVNFIGDGNKNPLFPYVANLNFNLGEKASFYIEGFGNLNTPTLNGDGGFAFKLGKDFVLDIAGGWLGGTNPDPHWFTEVGFTYRFSALRYFAKKKASQFMNKGQ